ncbi:MAG TPA: hypothetical protein VFW75_15530 [Acetobacteraceae bacterium]|nr:hypothetical protein [Acetobacteraceae bacterium]
MREALRTHANTVSSGTTLREQSAAYHIDRHPAVGAFVKNHGLNFPIPYLQNGKPSEYVPDWVSRPNRPTESYLIAELKGADRESVAKIKAQAVHRHNRHRRIWHLELRPGAQRR